MRRTLAQLVAAVVNGLRHRRGLMALERLNDRDLADLGLTRAQLPLLAAQGRAYRKDRTRHAPVALRPEVDAGREWTRAGS